MEPRSLQFLADASGGVLLQGAGSARCAGVTTDSRRVKPDELFVALQGDRFDGHDFVAQVAAAGAGGVMISRDLALPAGCAVVRVDDTRRALGRIAAAYRSQFDLPVIGIAGSNGKTSTKELLAWVLRESMPVLWSEASFNNDIGVPLTLLRLESAHRAAVLELGTNHPGELRPLILMAQPQWGILTSIGREHLEHFGDLEGVAREEGVLAELLPERGKLFLYGDSPWSNTIAERSSAPVVRAGWTGVNDWRARDIVVDHHGIAFTAEGPARQACGAYRLQLVGRHHVTNALLVIALAAELGLTHGAIAQGLSQCPPAPGRLQLRLVRQIRILDDTYNANADSIRAALATLGEMECAGKRIAVVGDFAELGLHTPEAQAEAGRAAAEARVDVLLAVGAQASGTAAAARAAGVREVHGFSDNAEAARQLRNCAQPGDVVLLKASRAARLEEVLAAFAREDGSSL